MDVMAELERMAKERNAVFGQNDDDHRTEDPFSVNDPFSNCTDPFSVEKENAQQNNSSSSAPSSASSSASSSSSSSSSSSPSNKLNKLDKPSGEETTTPLRKEKKKKEKKRKKDTKTKKTKKKKKKKRSRANFEQSLSPQESSDEATSIRTSINGPTKSPVVDMDRVGVDSKASCKRRKLLATGNDSDSGKDHSEVVRFSPPHLDNEGEEDESDVGINDGSERRDDNSETSVGLTVDRIKRVTISDQNLLESPFVDEPEQEPEKEEGDPLVGMLADDEFEEEIDEDDEDYKYLQMVRKQQKEEEEMERKRKEMKLKMAKRKKELEKRRKQREKELKASKPKKDNNNPLANLLSKLKKKSAKLKKTSSSSTSSSASTTSSVSRDTESERSLSLLRGNSSSNIAVQQKVNETEVEHIDLSGLTGEDTPKQSLPSTPMGEVTPIITTSDEGQPQPTPSIGRSFDMTFDDEDDIELIMDRHSSIEQALKKFTEPKKGPKSPKVSKRQALKTNLLKKSRELKPRITMVLVQKDDSKDKMKEKQGIDESEDDSDYEPGFTDKESSGDDWEIESDFETEDLKEKESEQPGSTTGNTTEKSKSLLPLTLPVLDNQALEHSESDPTPKVDYNLSSSSHSPSASSSHSQPSSSSSVSACTASVSSGDSCDRQIIDLRVKKSNDRSELLREESEFLPPTQPVQYSDDDDDGGGDGGDGETERQQHDEQMDVLMDGLSSGGDEGEKGKKPFAEKIQSESDGDEEEDKDQQKPSRNRYRKLSTLVNQEADESGDENGLHDEEEDLQMTEFEKQNGFTEGVIDEDFVEAPNDQQTVVNLHRELDSEDYDKNIRLMKKRFVEGDKSVLNKPPPLNTGAQRVVFPTSRQEEDEEEDEKTVNLQNLASYVEDEAQESDDENGNPKPNEEKDIVMTEFEKQHGFTEGVIDQDFIAAPNDEQRLIELHQELDMEQDMKDVHLMKRRFVDGDKSMLRGRNGENVAEANRVMFENAIEDEDWDPQRIGFAPFVDKHGDVDTDDEDGEGSSSLKRMKSRVLIQQQLRQENELKTTFIDEDEESQRILKQIKRTNTSSSLRRSNSSNLSRSSSSFGMNNNADFSAFLTRSSSSASGPGSTPSSGSDSGSSSQSVMNSSSFSLLSRRGSSFLSGPQNDRVLRHVAQTSRSSKSRSGLGGAGRGSSTKRFVFGLDQSNSRDKFLAGSAKMMMTKEQSQKKKSVGFDNSSKKGSNKKKKKRKKTDEEAQAGTLDFRIFNILNGTSKKQRQT